MFGVLRKVPLRLQASIYASTLHERLGHYPHVSDLTFRLCGRNPLPSGINQLNFSGVTQFISRAQIKRILDNEQIPEKNIAVARKENSLEITIDFPQDIPLEIQNVRRWYLQKMEVLVDAERAKPINEQFGGQSITSALKGIHLEVMTRVVEIAKRRVNEKFGIEEDQFAVFLVAGSAGRATLSSDLDFMVVFNGKNRIYFNYLAQEIEKILKGCGIKGENAINSLSRGQRKCVQIDTKQDFIRIAKFAADALPVEAISDQDTIELFFKKLPTFYNNERRLLSPYYLPNIWLGSFYLIDRRSKHLRNRLEPSLETRKIGIATALLRTEAGFCSLSFSNGQSLLQEFESRGFISQTEVQQIEAAETFFNRLKNALGCIHRGRTNHFSNAEIPFLGKLFGYKTDSLGETSFRAEIKRHSDVATNFINLATSRNLKKQTRQIYNLLASIRDVVGFLWQRIRNLGFNVALYYERHKAQFPE